MKILKLNEAQICAFYRDGQPLIQIAKTAGIKSYGPIKRILRKNSITLRRKGELRPRGKLNLDIQYFANIDSPSKAYWLGFLTADGNIQQDGYKASLISKDLEVIQKFKKAINSSHAININRNFDKRTKRQYLSYSIQITCKHFVDNLKRWGMTPKKSFTEKFPEISKALYGHYLRGLFDGDGSICFLKNGQRKISLIAAENLLKEIQKFLINKLFFAPTVLGIIAEEEHHRISKLYIHNQIDQQRFLELIYTDSSEEIRLNRKYLLFLR